MTDNTDRADSQARAQVDSIVQMVAALECDFDRLEELRDEREGLTDAIDEAQTTLADAEAAIDEDSTLEDHDAMLAAREALAEAQNELEEWDGDNGEELAELTEAAGDCEDHDEARERIQEDALSLEVRSGWQSAGETLTPDEFRIVLCTGGPHVEIRGDLDHHGEPSRVRICYSDWGTSGELFDFDHDAVMTYAREFVFAC